MEYATDPNVVFLHPFDDEDGDLIVRSSDGKLFRVHKVILAKASSVFKSMLTVPQPNPSMDIDIPLVPLSEDGETLLQLFQLCYPVADPTLTSLDEISHLQVVCDKYDMEGLMQNLARQLGAIIECDPLRVFAIACCAKFIDKARRAAKYCLSRPLSYILETHVPEYTFLSVDTYKVLPAYHHRCTMAAANVASASCGPWIPDTSFCFFQCNDCPASENTITHPGTLIRVLPRRWWRVYMDSVSHALTERADVSAIASVPKPSNLKLNCHYCGARFREDLERFLPLLEHEVQRSIDLVELKIVV